MTTLLKPRIDTITITPNPVNQNTAYIVQISVSEIEIELEPILIYCGSFYCGEDGEI